MFMSFVVRKFFLVSMTALAVTLVGCGGGGGGGSSNPPSQQQNQNPNPDVLTVQSVYPPNGSNNVSTNSLVMVTFNRPMDPATINSTSVFIEGIEAAVNYDPVSSSAVLVPQSPLAANQTFTVTIAGSVSDANGETLGVDFSWQFRTDGSTDELAPTVLSITPQDGATSVDVSTPVVIQFSELINPASIDASSVSINGVQATLSYQGNSVQLIPASPLEFNQTYTVTVTTAVTDLAANALPQAFSAQFTTVPANDSQAPQVAIATPADGTVVTSATLNVSGTASDNVGVVRVTWSNSRGGSGVALGTDTWQINGITLQRGGNLITVRAIDGNNNEATATVNVTYDDGSFQQIDTQPPTIAITAPTNAPTFSTSQQSIRITGTASDDVALQEVTWSTSTGKQGTALGTDVWRIDSLPLIPGVNVLTVVAVDTIGNAATDTLTITYTVSDTTPPTVQITSPTSSGTHTTDLSLISLSGSASDDVELKEITWVNNRGGNGVAVGLETWRIDNIPLQSGGNIITVTARDQAGNAVTDTISVTRDDALPAEGCMLCHNGSFKNDYAGPDIENPHPFSGAQNITCTKCHGGDPLASTKDGAHVPVPPFIGDRTQLAVDPAAYFNRLTLTGIDKLPDYTNADGSKTFTSLQYLQFINPGDLRVVSQQMGCGNAGCHADKHAQWVVRSVLATETGFFSGAMYAAGIENQVPENRGFFQDTAADLSFRAVQNPGVTPDENKVGVVGRLIEFPVRSQFGGTEPDSLFLNDDYLSANLPDSIDPATNRVRAGSPLANLYHEMVAFTCGDCHLGSAGANNRYGDFRSSGCTACHMIYSPDGKSRSRDKKVRKNEPANPDQIAAPERPHVEQHMIVSTAKTLPDGRQVQGIPDRACAGCHQGSNRTVMQYWGIRLDQNQDLVNGFQYPAQPVTFTNTANDPRLFDPNVGNNTFNGRNANQYILEEDYDGDGRDDTPPDVHYAAGMGCIDCHGSRDLHNGTEGDPTSGQIVSRHNQSVGIQCESCHGRVDSYAATVSCTTYDDQPAQCAVDRFGNPLRHVTKDPQTGEYFLKSRLTGKIHYVSQTRDVVVNTGKTNPLRNNEPVYNPKASYAMGRADGNDQTGIGPLQNDPAKVTSGFSHTDTMDCVSCHASWTNNCIGCHLGGQYDDNPANFFFSNITGERIVFFQANADFTYQTPVPFQLGVGPNNRITQTSPSTEVFFRYTDRLGVESQVFLFTDRNGNGNNPNNPGANVHPAGGHNVMMAHSIRGAVDNNNEGVRYCVACHLTTDALANYGTEYDQFRTALFNNDYSSLDFNLLRDHIGLNTSNQLNSPIWVNMVAGLGSGLFLFDETGCPVNPLDNNANRQYCPNGAPAANFDPATVNNVVRYDLDRIVETNGVSNASSNHPLWEAGVVSQHRDGALNPRLSGTLGARLVNRLADPNTGIVLDSWLDADGNGVGKAGQLGQ